MPRIRHQAAHYGKCMKCPRYTGHGSGVCQKCRGNKKMRHGLKEGVGSCSLFEEKGLERQIVTTANHITLKGNKDR